MEDYYKYWGKAARSKEEMKYHLLVYHSLDVAAVGVEFLKVSPLLKHFSKTFDVKEDCFLDSMAFLYALHDIGKFAEGFQNLRSDIYKSLNNKVSFASYSERHWSLGYRFLCDRVQLISNIQKDIFLDSLDRWLAASAGHHGRPPENKAFSYPVAHQFSQQGINDASDFIQEIRALFHQSDLDAFVDKDESILRILSWDLAGMIVFADWIGSNEIWFKYRKEPMPWKEYWTEFAIPSARKAVKETRIAPLPVAQRKNISQLFPDITNPTSLQNEVDKFKISNGPKLIIIEDLTGSGKTEAALTLTHRLMTSGEADGFYFALPTMATANAMHDRVEAVYKKLYKSTSDPSLVLAHSMSKQYLKMENDSCEQSYTNDEESAGQDFKEWLFDNRKKAFLANVGVGTIDQALLGVLPVKHQALRLVGMYRKVLIIDEVHAYDSYANKLLCTLLEFHTARGGCTILLSATLPQVLRRDFVNAFASGMNCEFSGEMRTDYPLLTTVSREGFFETPVSSPEHLHKKVHVKEVHDIKEVLNLIKLSIEDGKCVCWIRNTVHDAIDAYNLAVDMINAENVNLFHARFALGDRLLMEQFVVNNFGPKSSAKTRKGKLVVATQVVEQSLDIDFDFMVTDLAPVDLIIQRAGRLCRHRRDALGNRAEKDQRSFPEMAVYMPQIGEDIKSDWFSSVFPKAAKVYEHHGQLWLTAKWLSEHKAFKMPDDARNMIEYVYGNKNQSVIPEPLQLQENNAGGNDRAQAGVAQYYALKLRNGYAADMLSWPDDENVSTRSGERTMTVRLALWKEGKLVPYFNNDWMLSQVSVYRFLIMSEDEKDQKAIGEAKMGMPGKGKYCVLVPLKEIDNGFEGFARDGQGQRTKIYYDSKHGLRVQREGG